MQIMRPSRAGLHFGAEGSRRCVAMALVAVCSAWAWSQPPAPSRLAEDLQPYVAALLGESVPGGWTAQLRLPVEGHVHEITVQVERYDAASFDLQITHRDYAVALRRRQHATALALPKHGVVFLGRGGTHEEDHLHPQAIFPRLIRADSKLYDYLPLVAAGEPQLVAATLVAQCALRARARYPLRGQRRSQAARRGLPLRQNRALPVAGRGTTAGGGADKQAGWRIRC